MTVLYSKINPRFIRRYLRRCCSSSERSLLGPNDVGRLNDNHIGPWAMTKIMAHNITSKQKITSRVQTGSTRAFRPSVRSLCGLPVNLSTILFKRGGGELPDPLMIRFSNVRAPRFRRRYDYIIRKQNHRIYVYRDSFLRCSSRRPGVNCQLSDRTSRRKKHM